MPRTKQGKAKQPKQPKQTKKTKKRKRAEIESDDDSDKDGDYEPEVDEPAAKKTRTSKRVASKAEKKQKDSTNKFGMEASAHESMVIVAPSEIKGASKIACFDMDHTLVKPKGSKKFPTTRSDWVWMWDEVPEKLKEIYKSGFKVVIISNQNGIGNGKQSEASVTGKILDLATELDIPLTAVLATQKDYWRKPNTGMWDYFVENLNDGVEVSLEESYYVGDAAGRPAQWDGDKKTKKDFSCGDRKFGHNIGIGFHTPEAYFLGQDEYKQWEWRTINPQDILDAADEHKDDWFEGTKPIARKDRLDLVIMVGPPGSGKSTFSKNHLVSEGYEWVNRDTLSTPAKCKKATEEALKAGKSVVIDNTNPDYKSRKVYLDLAEKYKATTRCFIMQCTKEAAEHMNLYREKLTKGAAKRIPGVAFNMFFKKLREDEPTKDEGYEEVCKIHFKPEFENDEDKALFLQFT